MPLILAVEPDRRQAANLAAVLRARPKTELVIAESAALALEALCERVPDVLLTSQLLSRRDEAALAGWLRGLGPAAAHVQELTIPILAATSTEAPAPKKRGMLSSLRRGSASTAAPSGCEPGAFAEQVSDYATRAAAGRKFVEPPPVELILLPPTEADVELDAEDSEPLVALPVGVMPLVFDPPSPPESLVASARQGEPASPVARFIEEIEPDVEALLEDVMPLVLEAEEPAATRFVEEIEPDIDPLPEDVLPLVCLDAEDEHDDARTQEGSWHGVAPAVIVTEEPWVSVELEEACEEPAVMPDDVWVLAPVTDIDELLELVTPKVPVVAAPPPPPPPPQLAAPKKRAARPKKPKPVQDEWGFFDPDQCGFAALLAKLDEITDQNDEHDSNTETTVRVIGY